MNYGAPLVGTHCFLVGVILSLNTMLNKAECEMYEYCAMFLCVCVSVCMSTFEIASILLTGNLFEMLFLLLFIITSIPVYL